MPQQQDELAGLTVLHVAQPVEGGVARVVTDLARAQVRGGARVVVACPVQGGRPDDATADLVNRTDADRTDADLRDVNRTDADGTDANRADVNRRDADRTAADRTHVAERDSGHPGGAPALPHTAAAAGAEVVHWAARRAPGPGLLREAAAAARLVRAVRPDLLHLHSAKAGLAGRLAVRGTVPTVFQPHAWSFDAVGGGTARAARRWERYAARWTDRVLCVSQAECVAGRRAGVPADWAVVPNGVDLARFTPVARRDEVRAALPALSDLGPDAPLVVCVGRLCEQKGQDVLLRAWPAVTAALPAARLVLVGDGPDHRRLLLGAPRGVILAGAARDAAPWYQAADVVVQPSRWEGMALAPLEAMACGRPVVTTDVSGARESLPPADAGGCVVPVGDERALAAALLRLLADPALRTAASLRALAHARAHHDVRRAAASVAALYRDVLGLPALPSLPHRHPVRTPR